MRVTRIILERRDERYLAGVLTFGPGAAPQILPWSVDLDNPRHLIVDFYPDPGQHDSAVVQVHQNEFADRLLAWIARKVKV